MSEDAYVPEDHRPAPPEKKKYRDLRKTRVRSDGYKARQAAAAAARRAKRAADPDYVRPKRFEARGTASGKYRNVKKSADRDLVLKTATGQIPLSPGQVAHLRGKIGQIVRDNLDTVAGVLDGSVKWSPTQARVFSNLLNKVVPDLSASFHQHEHRNQDLAQMSRADLERIALGLDDMETIQGEFVEVPTKKAPEDDLQPAEGRDPVGSEPG